MPRVWSVGVYEPAAVLEDGSLRLTSLASEPRLDLTQALLVHADCGWGADAAFGQRSLRSRAG